MEKMQLTDILQPENVVVGLSATDRDEAFRALVGLLTLDKPRREKAILAAVREREAVQTTGIGYGIAIPHGKAEITRPIAAALGITKEPIEYESVDGEPVRILILMVSRPDVTGPHVHMLAQAARFLGHRSFRESLLACATPEAVVELIRAGAEA